MFATLLCTSVRGQIAPVYYRTAGDTNWYADYRNQLISGIAGDTLELGVKLAGINDTLCTMNWRTWDNNGVEIPLGASKIFKVTLPNGSNAPEYGWYFGTLHNSTPIWSKFIPPSLLLSSSSAKTIQDTLRLSDFKASVSPNIALYSHSKPDSIFWYRSGDVLPIKASSANDTLCAISISGEYSIKIKTIYTNHNIQNSLDSVQIARWKHSNTITVTVTGVGVVENSENKKINVYPNPTSDYLYFSTETFFEIYEINGKKVCSGFAQKVNVGNLSGGVYLAKTQKGIYKFIVN